MNMLLKQCEDLHKLAADADMEKDTRHFRDPLLEAANTIMVLHDELHAENAKLRELVQYICDENYGDDWFAEKAAELGIEAHY